MSAFRILAAAFFMNLLIFKACSFGWWEASAVASYHPTDKDIPPSDLVFRYDVVKKPFCDSPSLSKLARFYLRPFQDDNAMTPEQKAMIHQHFEELGMECMEDYTISAKDINDLRAKQLPSGDKAPCFLACVMKKVGVLDESGMLQKETVLELAKKVFDDGEDLEIIHDFLHSCSHVNAEPVSDGKQGCERAIQAYKCMLENAPQFGIDL